MADGANARRLTLASLVISLGFVTWAVALIARGSFVAIDGQRYFSIFDDALISMRYAWNLAHGDGLVWNPGERVEGYTNLLMVFLMAIPSAVTSKRIAVLVVQLLGVPTLLAAGHLNMRIGLHAAKSHQQDLRTGLGIASFVVTLAYYPLAFWTLMGMETGLVTVLLMAGVLLCLRLDETPGFGPLAALSLISGMAVLARPDSLLPAVAILAWAYSRVLRGPPGTPLALRHVAGAFVLFLALPTAQILFRLAYYGELVPNTYLLKVSGIPLGFRIANGLSFLMPFLVVHVPLLLPVALASGRPPRRWPLLVLSVSVATWLYQVWAGGDAWPYWRLLAPTVPLVAFTFLETLVAPLSTQHADRTVWLLPRSALAIAGAYLILSPLVLDQTALSPGVGVADAMLMLVGVALGVSAIWLPRLARLASPQRLWLVPLVSLTGALLLCTNAAFLPEITLRVRPFTADQNAAMIDRALAVDQVTTSNATVGVTWAGSIPYYSGRVAIDFLGKNDRLIARLAPDLSGSVGWYGMRSVPGHNKYDLDYSLRQLMPTYVQTVSWGAQDYSEWADRHYVRVVHRGVELLLLRESPEVMWERITGPE